MTARNVPTPLKRGVNERALRSVSFEPHERLNRLLLFVREVLMAASIELLR